MGVEVDVVLYMKEPPGADLLARIAAGLDGPVQDLVRKDSQFRKLELVEDDYVGDAEAVVDLLARQTPHKAQWPEHFHVLFEVQPGFVDGLLLRIC